MANLSTDLRRISNWIYEGKDDLVSDNIQRIRGKYRIKEAGVYEDIWKEVDLIKSKKEDRARSADRATTLSSILLQESLKE